MQMTDFSVLIVARILHRVFKKENLFMNIDKFFNKMFSV